MEEKVKSKKMGLKGSSWFRWRVCNGGLPLRSRRKKTTV